MQLCSHRKLKPSMLQSLLRNLVFDVPQLPENSKMPLKVWSENEAFNKSKANWLFLVLITVISSTCSCWPIIMSRAGSTIVGVMDAVALAPPQRKNFVWPGGCFGGYSVLLLKKWEKPEIALIIFGLLHIDHVTRV